MKLQDGFTLVHEHMSIDLSPGDLGTGSFELLCSDLKQAYKYGVRNIVDLTNQSMGRAPEYVRRLSEETGINMILSTGYYLEKFLGKYIKDSSAEEIAAGAVRDLTTGIGESGIRADVIGEIAWCHEGPGELEMRSWEAMCIAGRKTGAVVSTHPSRGIQQIPQAEYLIANGISPEKIVIGHIEFYPDDDSLKKLLGMGVYIGLDMIGKAGGKGDEYRAETVCKVKEWGCLSQLMLSMDICRVQDLRSAGGYGYAHLFESFIPRLKDKGISAGDVEVMLRDNPKRLFTSM